MLECYCEDPWTPKPPRPEHKLTWSRMDCCQSRLSGTATGRSLWWVTRKIGVALLAFQRKPLSTGTLWGDCYLQAHKPNASRLYRHRWRFSPLWSKNQHPRALKMWLLLLPNSPQGPGQVDFLLYRNPGEELTCTQKSLWQQVSRLLSPMFSSLNPDNFIDLSDTCHFPLSSPLSHHFSGRAHSFGGAQGVLIPSVLGKRQQEEPGGPQRTEVMTSIILS